MRILQTTVVGVGFVAAACGPADAPDRRVTRVDSAGVEVVTSVLDDRELSWSFERLFLKGGTDEGPEAFYRVNSATVDADRRGQLYVLDAAQARVVVFGPEGEFVRLVGGRGEGPGEISSPGSLVVSPDGTLQVFDFGKGGLVRFDPTGAPLPEQPFGAYPRPEGGRHLGARDGGIYAAVTLPRSEQEESRYGLQLYEGADTILLTEVRFPEVRLARYPACGGGLSLPRVFEADIAWDNHGATVAAAAGPRYAITVFDGVEPVRRIQVSRSPRPATESMAVTQLGEGFRINFGQGLCVIPPSEMVPLRGFAEVLPWVADVAVSPSGEVWVRRFEVGPDSVGAIDLFDDTGAYLGTAPPDTPFPLAFLSADLFAAAEIDDTDVGRVAVYRVHREGG